jgi:UDP-N-acetylmuramoyl-tripeptide--D-alanyl-D-alanine ligase
MKELFRRIIIFILTWEAKILLHRHKPTIIAITGSVGKTSTKDAIYTAIKSKVAARKSEKSFNSEIGIPLTVLGLPNGWNNPLQWLRNIIDGFFTALFTKEYPSVLVLEAGIDRKGDMHKLKKWLSPDIVVLTRLPKVPVHVEYFDSPEAVVAEKMVLVSAMKPDGVLVYNHDDDIIKAQLPNVIQRKVGFGRYLETNFTAREDRVVYQDDLPVGIEFDVQHESGRVTVQIKNTVGTQHMFSCLGALTVAHELGITLSDAADSLSELTTPPGRMRIVPGLKATMILDDTYNSSPIAAEQALQALKELSYTKRKIAVLGDMLELGKYSTDEHRRIGEIAAGAADVLVTVGVRSRNTAEAALAHGLSEDVVFQYDDVARAGRELQNLIAPSDVILIKASQGLRLEKIVEEIMLHPESASDCLVRQDVEWKKR